MIGSGPRIVTSRHRMLCEGRAAVQRAQLRTVSFPHLIESGNHNREERGEKRGEEGRRGGTRRGRREAEKRGEDGGDETVDIPSSSSRDLTNPILTRTIIPSCIPTSGAASDGGARDSWYAG